MQASIYRINFLFFIALALMLSCSKEDVSKIECLLTKIVIKSNDIITQTIYSYDASGKIIKQVRTRNGVTIFDYTYSYNTDNKVDKVDRINEYSQYEYGSDGKVATITVYTKDGIANTIFTYKWSGNNVEIKVTKPGVQNPYQITNLEFLNDNVVKETIEIIFGNEPNIRRTVIENIYEDYDTALSAFYIASSARPGFSDDQSKNNPRKQTTISKTYEGGVITQESTSSTVFSYTYNASNATIGSIATSDGTNIVETEITYEQCN